MQADYLNAFYRDTWVEVNLSAIEENIRSLKELYRDQETTIMAVVKADGYGHGAVEAAHAAIEGGATFLGVAILDEALALREAGLTLPILVLGRMRAENAALAAQLNISATVYSTTWLNEAEEWMRHSDCKQPLSIHLKCDTGMGRIGFLNTTEVESAIMIINGTDLFELEGVYTHFATADEIDVTYYEKQYDYFKQYIQLVEDMGVNIPYIHCANSAAAMRFINRAFSMVRFGISMYGLTPSPEINELLPFPLKPAFELKTRLVQVKKVEPGTTISYGATYTAKDEEWIGTLPIGYADGWIRAHSTNGGHVLIEGEEAPFVGRICMDQCMVKLAGPKPEGSVVTLIGFDGDESVTMEDVAQRLQTINYEIPCVIGKRVPRVYYKDGEIIAIRNDIR
ncbi:alanine racemase [Alkalicoccobacillus porphyridii]|uniref:Alanine racemase n=1 Tax=Alkalicoccobacillus porphyridii TaxID=2597270 RepID=A0A553ZWX5_9BACI|nr:alanine racemase [Alkalicoccobacillus porphyridii]TSB45846.1 alanine racemase [Alkalicoccobacillus porphyridii]